MSVPRELRCDHWPLFLQGRNGKVFLQWLLRVVSILISFKAFAFIEFCKKGFIGREVIANAFFFGFFFKFFPLVDAKVSICWLGSQKVFKRLDRGASLDTGLDTVFEWVVELIIRLPFRNIIL